MTHPLLNNDSAAHYDYGQKTGIMQLEEQATVGEQIGWCKGNIFKYEHRLEHKGQKESDLKKIETYKAYLTLLESLPIHARTMIVLQAYRKYGVRLSYWIEGCGQ